ncbi:MAG: alpha/beta fold hydrolase [Chitinivibrionales bacterium]|nr:alpha/beta fold hydrolase [Chitinivibrionales bacterium]
MTKMYFDQWDSGGKTICASIHPTTQAGRPWVVIAHGFTADRIGKDYLLAKLSKYFAHKAIASLRFDFAGCGESEGEFHEMNMTSMRDNLLSAINYVRKRFVPSKLILLGHSLGGSVCALLATRAGADGVVLLAPVARPFELFNRLKKDVVQQGKNSSGFYEYGPHQMREDFLSDAAHYDPLRDMTQFHGRLLVIHGDSDQSAPIHESETCVHHAETAGIDCRYYRIKNADHNFSTVSQTRIVFEHIGDWIEELCA